MSDDGRSEQSARWERLELQRLEVELDKTRAEVEKIQAEARHVHHMSRMQGVLKQATPTLIVAILGVAGPTTSWIYSQYQLEASRTEWELTFASDQLDKALADLPVETRIRTRLHFLDAYEFASNGVEDAISAGLREIDEEVAAAEKALDLMVKRGSTRTAFGKQLIALGKNLELVSRARIEIEAMRLMVLKAAKAMDVLGHREARVWISMVKAMVPEKVCTIIDQAMQIHGATGISQWPPLSEMYVNQRHLRFADGPDEVRNDIFKLIPKI